MRQST